MSRCACEGNGSLQGVLVVYRPTDGFLYCNGCNRRLVREATLESAALRARGARLLTEQEARAHGVAAAEAERRRERRLSGLPDSPSAASELSEEQKVQRRLAGFST